MSIFIPDPFAYVTPLPTVAESLSQISPCRRAMGNYSNYMETIELKITRIGNSRGLRLPAQIISKYKLGETVILEQRKDEIALRPKKQKKLSWKETYREMAAAEEDWSDFDKLSSDGLE